MSVVRGWLRRALGEVSDRGVVTAVVTYAAVGWITVEVLDTVLGNLPVPDGVMTAVVVLYLLGFPVVAALAWTLEITRDGIQRAPPVKGTGAPDPRRAWRQVAGVAVIVAVTAGVTLFLRGWLAQPDGGLEWSGIESRSHVVAVMPLRVSDDPALAYLEEGMMDLLHYYFEGAGRWAAADPGRVMRALAASGFDRRSLTRDEGTRVARLVGADHVLMASAIGVTDQVTVRADLVHVEAGRTFSHVESGPASEQARLAHRVVVALVGQEAGEEPTTIPTLADAPPEAVNSYLRGQAALRRGAFEDAYQEFSRALSFDPTFAPAGMGFWHAAGWTANPSAARGLEAAWAGRDRLGSRDRVLLEAVLGPRYPDPSPREEMIDAWERAAETLMDRPDAWYHLGDRILHAGSGIGLPDWKERATEYFDRALSLDSLYSPAIAHRNSLAVLEGDEEMVEKLTRRIEAAGTSGAAVQIATWQRSLFAYDPLERIRSRVDGGPNPAHDFSGMSALALLWVAAEAGLYPEAAAATDQVFGELLARTLPESERVSTYRQAFFQRLAAGRPGDARSLRPQVETVVEPGDVARWEVVAALAGEGSPEAAEAAVRELESVAGDIRAGGDGSRMAEQGVIEAVDACLIRLWRLRGRGESVAIPGSELVADGRGATPDSPDWDPTDVSATALCAAVLRALDPGANPDERRRRVQVLDRMATDAPGVPTWVRASTNLILADLWEDLGDLDRALIWARAHGRGTFWFFPARALLREAQLLEAMGDSAAAVTAYRHHLAFRANPEPAVLPQVREAEEALQRLLDGSGGG